jgi:hypothetical protein
MSVMSEFDPDDVAISKKPRQSTVTGMRRITSFNSSTGIAQVEGEPGVPYSFYVDMGGHVKLAPMADPGIDQDPAAHQARRPRSLADVVGIDQLS